MPRNRIISALLLSFGIIAVFSGTPWAETTVEKRIAEFKGGEAGGASQGDKVNQAAGHGEAPPAPVQHKPAARDGAKADHGKGHSASRSGKQHGGRHDEQKGVGAAEGLKMLLDGNKRYVANRTAAPHRSSGRRAEIATGQHPFSIIVSCSDSRVPPEIIFDRGLGDLFVVRTAGNVVDDVAIGSIEYAVDHLGVSLIMVLGHERCGAVDATVKGGAPPGQIGKVVENIKPALEKAKGKNGDYLTNCITANVKVVAEKIKGAKPIISEHLEDGALKVVGAYYDLDTGKVTVTYNPYLPM